MKHDKTDCACGCSEYDPISEWVEEYIRGLEYTKATDEYAQTLVACNIRTFAHALRAKFSDLPTEGNETS